MSIEQNGRALRTFVSSFQHMKHALHTLMDDGLVRCDHCDQPAKRIAFQDEAEWWLLCGDHYYGFGEQWTGSTRFQPHTLWVAVFPGKAQAWLDAGDDERRERWFIEPYDTRDIYALLADDDYATQSRITYPTTGDFSAGVVIHHLTTEAYAYQIYTERPRHRQSYGLVGTFASANEALQHAMDSSDMPQFAKDAYRKAHEPSGAHAPESEGMTHG